MLAIKPVLLQAPMLKQVAQPKLQTVLLVPHLVPLKQAIVVLPVPSPVPRVLLRAVPRVLKVRRVTPLAKRLLTIR